MMNGYPDVFLGGSCRPTTWRANTAIPLLEKAGITYYNPQEKPVDDWGLRAITEKQARANAEALLFVIGSQTRGTASMVEAATCLGSDPDLVYLVINDIYPGTEIDGALVGERELRDLNRGRAYLRAEAEPLGVTVHESVTKAVEAIIADW